MFHFYNSLKISGNLLFRNGTLAWNRVTAKLLVTVTCNFVTKAQYLAEYLNFSLTFFFPMFPFNPPENIRKPLVFSCFQGDQKGVLGRKGSNCVLSFSLIEILKMSRFFERNVRVQLMCYNVYDYYELNECILVSQELEPIFLQTIQFRYVSSLLEITKVLIVCSYHVTYAFQSESKEFFDIQETIEWIHSETCTWHGKNIQSNAPYR